MHKPTAFDRNVLWLQDANRRRKRIRTSLQAECLPRRSKTLQQQRSLYSKQANCQGQTHCLGVHASFEFTNDGGAGDIGSEQRRDCGGSSVFDVPHDDL